MCVRSNLCVLFVCQKWKLRRHEVIFIFKVQCIHVFFLLRKNNIRFLRFIYCQNAENMQFIKESKAGSHSLPKNSWKQGRGSHNFCKPGDHVTSTKETLRDQVVRSDWLVARHRAITPIATDIMLAISVAESSYLNPIMWYFFRETTSKD